MFSVFRSEKYFLSVLKDYFCKHFLNLPSPTQTFPSITFPILLRLSVKVNKISNWYLGKFLRKLDFASRYFAKIKFVVILLQALRLLINLSCSDEMVAPLLAVSCTNGLRALLDSSSREEELLRYAYSYIYLPTIWYWFHIVSLQFFFKSMLKRRLFHLYVKQCFIIWIS